METHLCVVGKENGENKDLMASIEVNKESRDIFLGKLFVMSVVRMLSFFC